MPTRREQEGSRELGAAGIRSAEAEVSQLTPREKLHAEILMFRDIAKCVEMQASLPDLPYLTPSGTSYLESTQGREMLEKWYVSFSEFMVRLDYIEDPLLTEGESEKDTIFLAASMRQAVGLLIKRANVVAMKIAG
jgi:hypothetical protein